MTGIQVSWLVGHCSHYYIGLIRGGFVWMTVSWGFQKTNRNLSTLGRMYKNLPLTTFTLVFDQLSYMLSSPQSALVFCFIFLRVPLGWQHWVCFPGRDQYEKRACIWPMALLITWPLVSEEIRDSEWIWKFPLFSSVLRFILDTKCLEIISPRTRID